MGTARRWAGLALAAVWLAAACVDDVCDLCGVSAAESVLSPKTSVARAPLADVATRFDAGTSGSVAAVDRTAPAPWYADVPEYAEALAAPARPTFDSTVLLGTTFCARCHPTQVKQWQSASHSRAMADPVFRALVARQRAEVGPGLDRFCTQCHSALGTRSGVIEPAFDFAVLPEFVQEGVSCETCHHISNVERVYNAGIVVQADGLVLHGPLADPRAPHGTRTLEVFDQSKVCGACHDVRTPEGMVLESPYAEWRDSPASAEGQTCQSCHMPTYTGAACNLAGVPERTDLHRHDFVGVAPPLVDDIWDNPELEQTLWARSEGLLEGAAQVALAFERTDEGFGLAATVTSTLGGHALPTGSTFNRQMWLSVEVRDANGTPIFRSGDLDEYANLRPTEPIADDGGSTDREPDRDLWFFHSRLLKADGTPTLFTWRAASIQRHSLAPLESKRHRYQLPPLASAAYPLSVSARLRFRALSPRLLRALDLDALVARLRIVDIATAHLVVADPET